MVLVINSKNAYCNQDAVLILFSYTFYFQIEWNVEEKKNLLQLIRHSIAILISFNISFLSHGKCMSVFAMLASPLFVDTEAEKKINFVLSAPLPLLSISYLFYLFQGLTSCPSYSWKMSLYLSLSSSQFYFYLPPFLSYHVVLPSLHFIIFHIMFWISCNLPCIFLFFIPDYFCIFLFILIGSIFISSIFIAKWHSLPLGIY